VLEIFGGIDDHHVCLCDILDEGIDEIVVGRKGGIHHFVILNDGAERFLEFVVVFVELWFVFNRDWIFVGCVVFIDFL